MPARSPSASPEEERLKKKHKHRARSPSPRPEKRHKPKKHRDSSSESPDERHKKHKSHRHDRRERHQDDRGSRRDRHREDSDDDHSRRPVKRERHNPDYDKYAQAATSSRWEDEEDRQRAQQRDRDRNDDRRRERGRGGRGRGGRGRGGGNPFRNRDEGERHEWGKPGANEVKEEEIDPKDKEKPDFGLSGKLTEETNTYRGVVIKYSEPAEARKPKKRWRFYPFKGEEALPVLHLHRQSAFLMGRDRKIADIPVDHPSCSKQHAVLQFRLVGYKRPDGTKGRRVRPYIIDLGSSNGTYVNNNRIDSERYVELMEKDVVKFGYSSREYVLLHGDTDTSELHEDDEDDEYDEED